MSKIDTCGMGCPQPVLMAKNAISSNPSSVEIIVDNNTAKSNVKRFLENAGYSVSFGSEGENILVKAKK